MSVVRTAKAAYAFRFDATRSRYFYYRTISLFSGHGEHGRDVRRSDPISVSSFEFVMDRIGEPFMWVQSDDDLAAWGSRYSWMLTPAPYAETRLAGLLEKRVCVKSPIGLFWDVGIRGRAASRRIPRAVRQRVLTRDKNRCIGCGSDGGELTMDHVIPFSRGGETTEGNLVSLCQRCNQSDGNQHHPHLFALAGLHHGWDPDLLKTALTSETKSYAVMLSQNILVSRVRLNESWMGPPWSALDAVSTRALSDVATSGGARS